RDLWWRRTRRRDEKTGAHLRRRRRTGRRQETNPGIGSGQPGETNARAIRRRSSMPKSRSSSSWTRSCPASGWELAYNDPNTWHFRFNGPTPEALVKGREKTYFVYFWNDLAADSKRSLPTADRNAYVAAYSRPGRMRAGWAYFAAWPETANDLAQMAKT